jgi:hypothetical protein
MILPLVIARLTPRAAAQRSTETGLRPAGVSAATYGVSLLRLLRSICTFVLSRSPAEKDLSMRSVLRPVIVGLAVAGMSVAGAATAQACGGHHGDVDIHKTSFSNEFSHNFNDNFSRNFNNIITFGDLNTDD